MKTIFAISVRTLVALCTIVSAFAVHADQPKPVGEISSESAKDLKFLPEFSDEFNSSSVDQAKWNIDPMDWGVWSWEPENTFLKDGSLHLQMVQESHKRGKEQFEYKSGIARGIKPMTYGYYEARVKGCDLYPGASPAFWLYSVGADNQHRARDGETVTYSEIDIIELQQGEYDFKAKKRFAVNRIDCNLHTVLLRNGKKEWVRPNNHPELCKNHYDSPWDPREDFHTYAVENTKETVVWYIDGKEVARKPNLYWHLPMHVTLSLGLRTPFVAYKDGERYSVPEKTTSEGSPTVMLVDYVRVWQNQSASSESTTPTKTSPTDKTRDEFIADERAKWSANGWPWDQAKVESNFDEIDANDDGILSGQERKDWFASKKPATSK